MSLEPAALLLATLRLRRPADADSLPSAWASVRTAGLDRLVRFEGCALWLWRRLWELEAAEAPPSPFRAWLAGEARTAAARNLLVDAEAHAVARLFGAAGIPHRLLKGVARRQVADRFPHADARATHDVDVLVPPEQAREAWDLLGRTGYETLRPARDAPGDHFHLPPLWNTQRVAIEIHTSTSPAVAPTEAWRRATAGGEATAMELLWHGMAHALRHHADAFRLRFLLDGAAILARPVALDWPEIGRRLGSGEIANRLRGVAWLAAAAWLAGSAVPLPIPDNAALLDLGCALRRRLAVLRRTPVNGRRLGGLLCWWTNAWCPQHRRR